MVKQCENGIVWSVDKIIICFWAKNSAGKKMLFSNLSGLVWKWPLVRGGVDDEWEGGHHEHPRPPL